MTLTVKELIERYPPGFMMGRSGKVCTDTTEFMDIDHGDVIALGGRHYLVLRDEAERRFGMEDPKFWVKRCRCLETGEKNILKLVFYENFPMKIGEVEIPCYRSPEKEARILDLVKNDSRFMQGFSLTDDKGNLVRVLELIRGKRWDVAVDDIKADHRAYVREHLPGLLDKFIGAMEAIGFLHAHGEKHGDIRRDHLWFEYGTGQVRWIDFDYTFDFVENPFGLDLFGLGSILLFLVGKGIHARSDLAGMGYNEKIISSLSPDDFSLMFRYRIINLRKLFPYLPEELNRVLMHYAVGSEVFYETVDELLSDLRPCIDLLKSC